MLKDHPDVLFGLPQLCRIISCKILAFHQHFPGSGPFQCVDQTDQRAFAGPAVADNAVNVPSGNTQADTAQGFNGLAFAFKGFVYIFNLNHGAPPPDLPITWPV
ncbi:hypothetical protein D3C75_944000 [compost metagenome]